MNKKLNTFSLDIVPSYFPANWIAWLKYQDRDQGKILHVSREKRGEV